MSPNGEELARALSVRGLGTILRHAFDGSCVGSVNMCFPVVGSSVADGGHAVLFQ